MKKPSHPYICRPLLSIGIGSPLFHTVIDIGIIAMPNKMKTHEMMITRLTTPGLNPGSISFDMDVSDHLACWASELRSQTTITHDSYSDSTAIDALDTHICFQSFQSCRSVLLQFAGAQS